MSLGPLMVDMGGRRLVPEDREILQHPLVGGVILFTRNFESVGQLQQLVAEIHALRSPHLIVAVDHEGGPVQRFREGFTHLPAMTQLGQLYDRDQAQGLVSAREIGWLLAAELRAIGIDISFTPVLDITRADSRVLKDRTFHRDPQVVAELAHRLMSGMQEAGMQASGKHFPGHGGVSGDSHEVLPVDERDYEDIYAQDMLPFERMIHYGLAGIMPAHVVYSAVDRQPAGFSTFWLKEILRQRLEFSGVIFSDDLSMAGAQAVGGYTDRAEAALAAGCDVLLVCNNRGGVEQILDELKPQPNPVLQMRIARMHGRPVKGLETYRDSDRWQQAVKSIRLLQDEYPLEMELEF